MSLNTIKLEDLLKIYSDETVLDIIEHWQSDIFVHPLTCFNHGDISMLYRDGKLHCQEKDCQYNQDWIPMVVLKYWKDGE